MKKLLSCIFADLVLTLLYLAIGSPFIFILYLLLLIMDLEFVLPFFVAVFAVIAFAFNIYRTITDKPRENAENDL